MCRDSGAPVAYASSLLTNGDLEVTAGQLAATPGLLYPDGLIHASSSIHANALSGWSIGGASIDVVPTAYWQSSHGGYSVDLIGTAGLGTISQTVNGLAPGSHYSLTFDFAVNPETLTNEGGSTKILQVSMTNTSLSPTQFTGTAGTRTKTNMGYVQEVLNFTATSSSSTLTMAALMPTGLVQSATASTVYCGPVIDNLDFEFVSGSSQQPPGPGSGPTGPGSGQTPVPEPTMPGLFVVGMVMLLGRQWVRGRAG